jgi:hypothetical protein
MPKAKGKIASSLHDPEHDIPVVKKIVLQRKSDVSGNSGTGVVAIGMVFPSGMVVIEWTSIEKSLGVYHSVSQLEKLHGHEGASVVRFLD